MNQPQKLSLASITHIFETTRSNNKLYVLAAIVGVFTGYGAILFRGLIGFLQNGLLYQDFSFSLTSHLDHELGLFIIPLPVIGFCLVAYLVRTFAPEARGHGVPEVIEAMLTKGGKIRKRIVGVKALASALTISTGGSVGREGPIVQIGAALGSNIAQFFQLHTKEVKVLVACGVSAAVAATFNTPIAGIILAIELIILEFRTRSFVPLVIATVFATIVSRLHLGNEPAFPIPEYKLVHWSELSFYLFLGILCGAIGVLTIKILYATEDFFDDWKTHYLVKAALGGLMIGVGGYFIPNILGVGYESIHSALENQLSFAFLFFLVFAKILAMSITLASGGSGGVFAPSLFIGAMAGGAFGSLVNLFFPLYTAGSGAYALVGMAAVFAATSRATLTAIVILFEMTLDYPIILPLMFACVISDLTAVRLFGQKTIYTEKLRRKGLSFVNDFGANILNFTLVRQIMTKEVDAFLMHTPVKEAYKKGMNKRHMIYPVINEHKVLMGVVHFTDIEASAANEDTLQEISAIMKGAPTPAYPEESCMQAMKKFADSRDPRLLVVHPKTKELVGIVSPTDFVRLSRSDAE